jgi:hypothetical protein
MYFCPNCNNVFDITKETQRGNQEKSQSITSSSSSSESQEGGKLKYEDSEDQYTGLIANIINNKIVTLEDVKKILNTELNPNLNRIYFICNKCGNKKPIKKGTLMFSKVSSDIAQSYSSLDVKEMLNSDILPRTRKYICPNDKCVSHTEPDKREAVFFRMNNTFRVKHICCACETVF